MDAGEYWTKISENGHSGGILNIEFLTFGEQKGCILIPNFENLLVLAISTDKSNLITFSKPAPEASPVLTLGKFQGSGMDYREPLPLPILSANRE